MKLNLMQLLTAAERAKRALKTVGIDAAYGEDETRRQSFVRLLTGVCVFAETEEEEARRFVRLVSGAVTVCIFDDASAEVDCGADEWWEGYLYGILDFILSDYRAKERQIPLWKRRIRSYGKQPENEQ